MKNIKLVILLFFGVSNYMSSQNNFVQREVEEKFNEYPIPEAISNIIVSNPLYDKKELNKEVSKSSIYDYNKDIALEIINKYPEILSIKIKGEHNENWILDLVSTSSTFSNLKVETSTGKKVDLSEVKAAYYRGIVRGQPKSLVSISLFKDEIAGFISFNKEGNYVIGKAKNSSEIILYKESELTKKNNYNCFTEDKPLSREESLIYNGKTLKSSSSLTPNCVQLYFETEFDIYQNKGSVNNVILFVTNLYNQSATLYANDGIGTSLSKIKVWDSPDPYTAVTTTDLLLQFKAATNSIDGNLGQLLTFRWIGGGEASGFTGICNPNVKNSLSVSQLESTFLIVPTYSWSIYVITHEFGHLFGSRHTHACVWNGNNTSIDGCSGYIEFGSCPILGDPPNGGTIMSYCHAKPIGINFSLGFGPQPTNVITYNVNVIGTCLTSCISNCIAAANIQGPTTTHRYIQAVEYISSSSVVNSDLFVQYKAGLYVDLTPGFYVTSGTSSQFDAFIGSCNAPFYKITSVSNNSYTSITNSWNQLANQTLNTDIQLNIYPNPVESEVNIDIQNVYSESMDISVVNVLGQVVKKIKITDKIDKTYMTKVDVSNWSAGYYFVKIKTDKNSLQSKFLVVR